MANFSNIYTFVFVCRNSTVDGSHMKLVTVNGAFTSSTQQATLVHRANHSASNMGSTIVSTTNTSGAIYNVNRVVASTTTLGNPSISDGVKNVGQRVTCISGSGYCIFISGSTQGLLLITRYDSSLLASNGGAFLDYTSSNSTFTWGSMIDGNYVYFGTGYTKTLDYTVTGSSCIITNNASTYGGERDYENISTTQFVAVSSTGTGTIIRMNKAGNTQDTTATISARGQARKVKLLPSSVFVYVLCTDGFYAFNFDSWTAVHNEGGYNDNYSFFIFSNSKRFMYNSIYMQYTYAFDLSSNAICHKKCATCTFATPVTSTACSSCANNLTIVSGNCDCATGSTYVPASNDCLVCHYSCATCTGSASN